MITLDDKLWRELKGGYKIVYDVSIPLRQLEKANEKKETEKIFAELWDELHHQGDVGLASYMVIPQLVRIARQKDLFDWNVFALCATIEQQRHLEKNPAIPTQYEGYYQNGLKELSLFIVDNIASVTDDTTFRSALSALAACSNQLKLSKAIIELSEDVIDEFLERF
jgi:hypothetical protein